MSDETELIETLSTLNHISRTLNQAVDVHSVLQDALAQLVQLMGLETGWIFLRDELAPQGFTLAAHHNLPPALDLESSNAWQGGCACQALCNDECLGHAYNEIQCSRLAAVEGDRRGLVMHASVPLAGQHRVLGILNVAASDWSAFSPRALTLLTNAANLMGIALERASLFDLLKEQHIHEQMALLQFSQQLLGRLDLDDLMQYLVGQVCEMLKVDACALLLPNDDPAHLDFRATNGWRFDPVAAHCQVPADERSGPGLAMHTQHPVLVYDLLESDLAPWMPDWLLGEGFRGHAVLPLLVSGQSVGALVINTRQPRLFHEDDVRFLRLMSNQAAIAIEKARLHERERRQQQLERELEIGRQIQLSMLPKGSPSVPGWEFAAYYQQARMVGGDFYDFFPLLAGPDRLGLVIGDVAGKGVPAALLMALGRTIIRTAAMGDLSPSAVLDRANELIVRDSGSDLFLTALYADLDTARGRLIYANAGHNRPLWYHAATGQIEELAARGIVLGSIWSKDFEEGALDVAPNDVLIFYTDGVTEAMNGRHEFLGEDRLLAAIAASGGGDAQQVVDAILRAVGDFANGVSQSDDLTLLIVRRLPRDD